MLRAVEDVTAEEGGVGDEGDGEGSGKEDRGDGDVGESQDMDASGSRALGAEITAGAVDGEA